MVVSTSIVCGQVVCTLLQSGRGTHSAKDIKKALADAGVTSVGSWKNYMDSDGYMMQGNYLARCIGGWKLTDESRRCVTVQMRITPLQNKKEVCKALARATNQFGEIVDFGDTIENSAE